MRVLVADDDMPARFMLENLVVEWGYEVEAVADGEEAWRSINGGQPPDIAVLDWMMPGMDGTEVCRRVKAQPELGHLYIVMVTGRTEKADLVEGLESGADDFLSKPVDPEELRCRLAVGARIVRYEQELREKNRALLLFRRAFQDSIQEMCIADAAGAILHVNPSLMRRYGYEDGELVGRSFQCLRPDEQALVDLGMSLDGFEQVLAEMRQCLADPSRGHWTGMVANQTKAGDIVWTQTHVSAIRDGDGTVVGHITCPADITKQLERELAVRLECYRAITEVGEARDNETGSHLKRMSEYALLLAHTLGLPRKFAEDIGVFAPLHDIGKVGITDAILLAERKLTPEEFDTMKTHTTIGYNILKDKETLELAAEIALSHHEKFNGKGYPRGLAGEDISLSGRIVALCDVYDALRSARPYKKPWTHEAAAAQILADSGTHFDPGVVEAFQKVEHEMRDIFDVNTRGTAEAGEAV
ncbi:MAG TPA: response regulator [Candidatus Hydrogenedentes bacterium]|nr:response regulator [Candidatus Hydrogenedentota bacterium]